MLDNTKEQQAILTELETFTTLYKDDIDRYILENEKWAIVYTEANEFVVFDNSTVAECFVKYLGEDCFSEGNISYGGFLYDIDEHEARIYLDAEIQEGELSIVSYNFDDKEYTLNINADIYEPSDSFNEFMENYNLAESMKADVEAFARDLESHNLTIRDLENVEYETLRE